MAKRGLSDVVTTVLIILLVLAAVVIVWSFVQPAIRGGAEQVPGQTACISLNVEPVKCVKNGATTSANVTYRYNSGESTLSGIKFILTRSDDTTIVNDTIALNNLPGKLESRIVNVSFGPTGTVPKAVSIAAVIRTDTGRDQTCTESISIPCS
ncbi:hypothetical protein KW805_00375 [Candidatus Pacearchaeota archaeon]|nr:hypothetical protein [Candidatus Pacearchaeota archaeon]